MDIQSAAEALAKECENCSWLIGIKAESFRIVVTVSDVAEAKKELPSSWCSYVVEVHKSEVVPTPVAPVE